MATTSEDFKQAVKHHQAGRLGDAETLYRRVLSREPYHPEALHLMGVIAKQIGRIPDAVQLINQAISFRPNFPEAYCNLGLIQKDLGQLDNAIAAFRRALSLKPNYPEAFFNLANTLKEQHNLEASADAYRRAIALRPNYAEAFNNLANVLVEQGALVDGVTAYRQAVSFNPKYSEAFFNLGVALRRTGQLAEAATAFRDAIAAKPNYPEAYNSLGNVLRDSGQLAEAVSAYRQAIVLVSNFPQAFNNLGNALRDQGNLDEAVAAFRHAITLRDVYPEAHNNLGNAYKDLGELEDAVASYRKAVAQKPDFAVAQSNLLYSLQFTPGYQPQEIAAEHRRWNDQIAEPLAKHIHFHSNDRSPDRRLRIGYVSPDLRMNYVGQLMMPLLENHDHGKFQIYCYSSAIAPDGVTDRLRGLADQWRDVVSQSDEQLATLIRQDQIDILVDLSLHMAGNRLLTFARKPAPVQVTCLAYPGTTGLKTIDYRLTDPYLDPPEFDDGRYSETSVRLPETSICYRPMVNSPPVNSLPAAISGKITFGCFSDFTKVTTSTLEVWGKILKAVPNSQLMIMTRAEEHRNMVRNVLELEGVKPDQLLLVGPATISEFFALYHQVDVSLDPMPYGSTMRTFDALWMGVPVVTLQGASATARSGVSILSNVGLKELIAHSEAEYQQLAIDLARDLPRLEQLRASLRQRLFASTLMDAARYTRNVEAAYRQMWQRYCQQ